MPSTESQAESRRPAEQRPRIRLEGVDHAYGVTRVLTGVDFELTGGTVTGLIGQNGAGKSTLLKVLTGAERPLSGSIVDGDEAVHMHGPKDALRRGISIVHQDLKVFPHLSIAENIFGLTSDRYRSRLTGFVDRAGMRADASAVLSELHMELDPRRRVDTLDQGEQKLVDIARAVATRPRFLILDEPTASLGPRSSGNVLGLIERMRALSIGVCFVTHRLHEIEAVADEVVVMRDGRVVSVMREQIAETQMVAEMLGHTEHNSSSVRSGRANGVLDGEVALVARARVRPWVGDTVITARRGELVGLYGLLGSGAKRFVRMVGGLEPEGALVQVRGGPEVKVRSPRAAIDAGISFIPEDRARLGVIDAMSVERNLCISRPDRITTAGIVRRPTMRRHYVDYQDRMSIVADSPETPIGNLSGGNAQKVMIGRAFFTEASVVVFEDPTHGVDVAARAQIHDLLRTFVDEGGTALVASTDGAELAEIADRIIAFREGEAVEEIDPSESVDLAADMSRAIGGESV